MQELAEEVDEVKENPMANIPTTSQNMSLNTRIYDDRHSRASRDTYHVDANDTNNVISK